jgi:hypothetical protein
VEQLNHEAEIATERYNEAVERLHAAEKRLEVCRTDRCPAAQAQRLTGRAGAFAALAYRNAGWTRRCSC